jgi:hypothetical protein
MLADQGMVALPDGARSRVHPTKHSQIKRSGSLSIDPGAA